jgi:diguanylate cyclase (GGDEF)-like protein
MTTAHAGAAGGAVFVDIDDLKTVNDNFSYSCGNKILRLIGADLAHELGPDSIVARISGDEFVAVLRDGGNRRVVEQLVTRLKERICPDYDLGMCIMNISASIGIAYP